MKALISAVRDALWAAELSQARLLCAVSGGCDSMALLNALCALRGEMGFELLASHVQHGLRGQASQQDEQFVRQECARLGVELLVEQAGLNGDMHTPGAESRARDARRRIFEQQMAQRRIDALLMAHHRDDQTETVLMHLLRGAGMEGLCGMKSTAPYGCGVVVRPFLALSRSKLESAMKESGLRYCTDQSNFEPVTPRNVLRLQVLPQLEALFPGAGAHIAQTANILWQDETCLAAQAQSLYQQALYNVPPLFMLKAEPLLQAPQAVAARVLRLWWQQGAALAGCTADERALSAGDTRALLEQLHHTCAAHNLPGGLLAQRGPHDLHLLRQDGTPLQPAQDFEQPILPETTVYALPHARIMRCEADASIPATSLEAVIPPDVLAQRPVLRAPRPGDRIHALGAPGSKPLRRLLTDRKVDPALRPALTVLAVGSDVLWIPSLCTAEALRMQHVPDGSLRLAGAFAFGPIDHKE